MTETISKLPKTWQTKRLDEVARIVAGSTPKTDVPSYWDGDIFWATPKDLSSLNGKTLTETTRKITAAGLKSCAAEVLPAGSVLFSSRAPIGLTAINEIPTATNQGFKSFIPKKDVLDSGYLYNWLRANRTYLDSLGNGATFKEVSKAVVSRIEIPLAPLAEQKRIAAILDKADAIRRKLQQSLRLSDDFLRSVFNDMFGNPVFSSKVKTVVKVADAGEVQLGRQRAPKYQSGRHTCPYVRVANVYENRISTKDVLSMDFNTSDFKKYRLEEGDILLNEGQSTELVGRPAMWRNEIPDCCFQNTLVRFKAKKGVVEPYYALFLFLHYLWYGRFASLSSKTSSVAHLGAARFAEMPFPLPDLASQKKFAKFAEKTYRSQVRLRAQVSEAETLFSSLQQRAFRGEL